MRLVFFGTADFAVPALTAIAKHVALVVTQPDRPAGRGLTLKASPVKRRALELGLPVEAPERCRAQEFVDRVRGLDADVLVVAAYGQILPLALLGASKRGAVNLHGSVLPRYRGAAPIQRCLLNGDRETGVTLMQMDAGMDTGDIIAIEKTPVDPDETAGDLFERLARMAGEMAEAWLPRIVSGDYDRTPQDNDLAVPAPKVAREETELRFSRPARAEYDRFRAFTPRPGAFLATSHGRLKLERARFADGAGQTPGTVVSLRPELAVEFSGGAITLLAVRPEGKKQMSGSEWANGARLRVGDCLSG